MSKLSKLMDSPEMLDYRKEFLLYQVLQDILKVLKDLEERVSKLEKRKVVFEYRS